MTSTGIERKLDELGRVVIPKEIRNSLNLPTGAPLFIHVEGSRIILEKSAGTCTMCGATAGVKVISGKGICDDCINIIKQA